MGGVVVFGLFFLANGGCAPETPGTPPQGFTAEFPQLDQDAAAAFARLALDGITREYPNKLDHVMNGEGGGRAPAPSTRSFSAATTGTHAFTGTGCW